MRRDGTWPTRCTLSGCSSPTYRPHHHHMIRGHLSPTACSCENIAEPGTRPRVDEDGHPKP